MVQSVNYLYVAANALKVYIFFDIMFRVFIFADPIPNKNIMPDFLEYTGFLNYLFIFRQISVLRRNVKIYVL